MAKVSAAEIAKRAQALYKPKDPNRGVVSTGADLKRPTDPKDFILAPENHVWRELTGLQGLPWNYIVQIAGAEDSGKSTIAGQFMGWAQAQGVYVILWDTEGKFDRTRFEKHFGGKADELNVVSTTTIRKGAGAVFKYIKVIKEADPKAKILIIHDSVGGSVSRARAEREIDDERNAQPGSEAVENSDYMRHTVATFDKYPHDLCLLLVNQMTMRLGPVPGRTRSGGTKISFHCSMIVELTRVSDVTKISNKVKLKTGIVTRAKISKNHLSMSDNSVHEMRVSVDATGWHRLEGSSEDPDDE